MFKDILELLGVFGDFEKSPECLEEKVTPGRHEQLCAFSFRSLFESFSHVHTLDIPRETSEAASVYVQLSVPTEKVETWMVQLHAEPASDPCDNYNSPTHP
jgi:hypothetical protein